MIIFLGEDWDDVWVEWMMSLYKKIMETAKMTKNSWWIRLKSPPKMKKLEPIEYPRGTRLTLQLLWVDHICRIEMMDESQISNQLHWAQAKRNKHYWISLSKIDKRTRLFFFFWVYETKFIGLKLINKIQIQKFQ